MPPFPSTIPTSRTFSGKLHRAAVIPRRLAPIRPGYNQVPYKPRPLPYSKEINRQWTADRYRSIPPKCGEQKRGHNNVLSTFSDLDVAKDSRHIPEWDKKIQREFEAKNPGPLHRRLRRKTACITISDDEPEDQHGRMDDVWTAAIWDELIKDKPEHWNLRDALRLGRTRGEDPSLDKVPRHRSSSPPPAAKEDAPARTEHGKDFIDAREWEGKDLMGPSKKGTLPKTKRKAF